MTGSILIMVSTFGVVGTQPPPAAVRPVGTHVVAPSRCELLAEIRNVWQQEIIPVIRLFATGLLLVNSYLYLLKTDITICITGGVLRHVEGCLIPLKMLLPRLPALL